METITSLPSVTRPGPRTTSLPSRMRFRPTVMRGRNKRHHSVKHRPRARARTACHAASGFFRARMSFSLVVPGIFLLVRHPSTSPDVGSGSACSG